MSKSNSSTKGERKVASYREKNFSWKNTAEQKEALAQLSIHKESDFDGRLLVDYPKVYVLATSDLQYLKIGISLDIKKRLSNIQAGCPFNLMPWLAVATPLARGIEKGLHGVFCDYNLRGEWFSLPNEQIYLLMDFFQDAKSQIKGANNALL